MGINNISNISIGGLIDTGSTLPMIDNTFCTFLQSPVHPFHMYHVFSAGAEGDHMAGTRFPVKGAELSILGLALLRAKFWWILYFPRLLA